MEASMTKTAKYQQIVDWIQERLDSGELRSGDRLEPEKEIGARFGISRQTVRHALSLLAQEGVLETVHGSGSYVKDNKEQYQQKAVLSSTVTIISSYVDGYIFPRILRSMVETLERLGYGARIMFTGNQVETERRLLKRLIEEESRDPMIVEPVMSGLPNPNLKYYRELQQRGIPILFFHSFYPELNLPHVSMDDVEAGRIATEYLISQGHTRIAGVFKADDGQGKYRYKGYICALYRAEIAICEERICWIDTVEQKLLTREYERLLKRLRGCTACLCYNDEVAHSLTEICIKQGIRIPEDLSIISIDNSELAKLNPVPLTSMVHPMEVMGVRTAENLVHLIKDPEFNATYEFVPEIKIRSSVMPVTPETEDEAASAHLRKQI